jgi:hypothetical protein
VPLVDFGAGSKKPRGQITDADAVGMPPPLKSEEPQLANT